MNTRRLILAGSLAVLLSALAPAADTSGGLGTPSDIDHAFVVGAVMAGATEIEASKLALSLSASNAVKAFARTMIDDHGKLAKQLNDTVQRLGLGPQGTGPDVNVMTRLHALKGGEFDKVYVQEVALKGHLAAVDLFGKESGEGRNADLKALAAQALPTLKHHLAMARKLGGAKQTARHPSPVRANI